MSYVIRLTKVNVSGQCVDGTVFKVSDEMVAYLNERQLASKLGDTIVKAIRNFGSQGENETCPS